jgi:hypothetical protein
MSKVGIGDKGDCCGVSIYGIMDIQYGDISRFP